jgi:hypothetical protein
MKMTLQKVYKDDNEKHEVFQRIVETKIGRRTPGLTRGSPPTFDIFMGRVNPGLNSGFAVLRFGLRASSVTCAKTTIQKIIERQ